MERVSEIASPALVKVRLLSDRRDRWRLMTGVACFGVVLAGLLAAVGLPPVDLHGPLHYLGIMMPTCGGTRAARLFAQGDLGGAWEYNPLGIAAVVGAVAMVARAMVGWVSGRWWTLEFATSRWGARLLWVLVVVMVAPLWARQQSIAPLLMAG